MATNVRRFASGDYIELGMGTLSLTGAVSFLALVLARSDATYQSVMTGLNVATGRFEFGREGTTNKDLLWDGTNVRTATGVTYVIADGWVLLAATKAAGTSTARFHVNKGAGFTHTNSDTGTSANFASSDRLRIGFAAATDPLIADLAFVSVWDGTVLSDGQLDGLGTSVDNVLALSPSGHWRLNQSDTAQNLTDSIGSANQQASLGTSVVTDTPWFNPDSTAVAPSLADDPPIGFLGRGAGW